MYRLKFLLFFLFLSTTVLAQQTAEINGYITDQTTAISGASISLKGTKVGATTDVNGFFKLSAINPGRYTIVISFVGYQSKSQEINLVSRKPFALNVSLLPDDNSLQNVEVQGRTTATELKQSGFTVNVIDLKAFQNTSADLNQILNKSTGVKVRENGGLGSDFNFTLNGLSGRQIRFFIDGIPMESFGSSLGLNNIPVNLAERIEVYKGVVPVELGADALGGAVNIVTNQSVSKYLDASVSYGSFNTLRAALSGKYKDKKTGLTFTFNGFHNSSDNDYLMRSNPEYDAAIKVVENNELVERDVRRFHSAYRSTMGQVGIGFTNKSWADQFEVNFLYSDMYKEIQTGANQNKVIGEVTNREKFFMPSIKYKKSNFLTNGLTATLFASTSIMRSTVPDTANYVYSWGGRGRAEPISGELYGIKSIYHYRNISSLARANFSYEINPNHSLNLNYNYSHFARQATEDLGLIKTNTFDEPNTIAKQVAGLAYQNNAFNKQLTTSVFGKFYSLSSLVRNAVFSQNQTYVKTDSEISNNYFGYGIASRYRISEAAGVKFSYEHAYRLQEGDELFGNGIDVTANINLKPENSDNINFGAYYNLQINEKHSLGIESAYFYRNAKDFIYFIPSGGVYSVYNNLAGAKINGVELELLYRYATLLNFSVNGTYQKAISQQLYEPNTTVLDMTYGDRVPNQPWLYANANLEIGQNDIWEPGTRLQLSLSSQFVNWFYLNWESRGSIESKNKIQTQFSHNIALAYSMANGRYNISAEVNNFTNELLYDNFRLQKPGRSAFIKLRYFIK
ncbi:carboxypeptidase-like regulatory domain-containing protein [Pedobacter sp. N23S346]|uniref:TonB-dependent receptor n=1 Tax=Pedobacter sp. N23S346 TaxID=3402750 RepID=UPI003AC45B8F